MIFKPVMEAIDFFEKLFNRKYGIRTLYMALLLIPSFCLLWLYTKSLDDVETLKKEVLVQKEITRKCENEKRELYDDVRSDVMSEFQHTLELINNFKTIVSKDNVQLKKQVNEIESEIDSKIK